MQTRLYDGIHGHSPGMAVVLFALLSFTLSAPPMVTTPVVRPGDEYVYVGTTIEENLRTDPSTRRQCTTETRYLILAVRDNQFDMAALTTRRIQDDDTIAKAVVQVTGAAKDTGLRPPAVHLELLRYTTGGSVQVLSPAVLPPPLVLNEKTASVPLAPGMDTLEIDAWPMRPAGGANPGADWLEATTKLSPTQTWSAKVPVVIDGAQVVECAGQQRSTDWERPTSADRPWSRTVRVWLSPVDGLARVIWRRVDRKEGSRLVTRTETRLDWKPTVAHRGDGFDRVRREIEFAWWFDREWTASNADQRPALAARIRRYCEDGPPTAYREAVNAVLRRAEAER